MSTSSRILSRAWIAVPLCAVVFLVGTAWVRVQRVEYVSNLVQEMPKLDPASPANLGGWPAQQIVPHHDNAAYGWVDLTRQSLATGEARVRRIDYENAPFGHAVYKASPYRWWLTFLAWCDHALSGRGLGLSLEHAALMADPLLQAIVFLATTAFVFWQFGFLSAALFSGGFVLLFPFAAEFLPGAPSDRGLVEICTLWSMLLLLAGIHKLNIFFPSPSKTPSPVAPQRPAPTAWFALAGVAAGLGLWLAPTAQFPVIAGIAVGGLLAAAAVRAHQNTGIVVDSWIRLWRSWGIAGATTVLVCYLVEFAPDHLGDWELRALHPLDGVAWLGLSEALGQGTSWIATKKRPSWLSLAGATLGLAALAALPVAIWRIHGAEYLSLDVMATRFSRVFAGAEASHLLEWWRRDGLSSLVLATFLPLLLLGPAVWLLTRRNVDARTRAALALGLGTAVIVLGYSCRWLSGLLAFDAVLLAVLAAGMRSVPGQKQSVAFAAIWFGLAMVALVPSAIKVAPGAYASGENGVIEADVRGLMERDLARWLATHSGGAERIVLAPPNSTSTLYHFGGLKGLASLDWENKDGLGVAVRIVSASTPEEAKELIDRRGVTHIVMPSWDPYLDIYARVGMGQLEGTFLSWLHAWKLPNWLHPVAYPMPRIPGFESGTITVFEVVDEQDDATASSRIAEYFLEMGQLDLAKNTAQILRRFPADMGAWVARAEVETATNDETALAGSFRVLLPMLKSGADRALAWDLRVGLAVVLARAKHADLAREQVRKCLAEMDEPNLRLLTTTALYRLQVLGKAYDLPIADQRLRSLALELLPPELRNRL